MLALKQTAIPPLLLSLFILLSFGLTGCSSELGTPPADSADPGVPSDGGEQGGGEPLQPGQLTAGEWRDLDDELEYLKVELQNVIERVERDRAQTLNLRLSVNFYRDEGDDYVVRSFSFSDDIPSVLNQLAEQRSSDGGDYPEAVDQALDDAINEHQWRTQASARLLFLVLDAPPHHEQDVLGGLQEVIAQAAQRGIRIIPVASSGVDKETEFLLRFLSISTGGTYIFLTDDSGIGNDHLEPTVGQYEVEQLNDLLVRVIGEYLVPGD